MLDLEQVTVRYGALQALDRVSLAIPTGQVVGVLGPSGSGKTTLLRGIAGLERPTAGRVSWDGMDVASVPPHRRRFGLMFQDHALFPHRDVGGNVAFGLRMERRDARSIRERVREVLALVGLPGTERRSVDELSGGEQQRVALARALAPAPRLLMLDEPLGSLDRELRERLTIELRPLFRMLGLTVLYVTHDHDEAFSIGDRVVIMRDGRVVADGSPEDLWHRPPSAFVARFLGFRNVVDAEVRDGVAATPWGRVPVAGAVGDGRRWILLRPDGFAPARDPGSAAVEGRVDARVFRGDHVLLAVAVDDAPPLEVAARWSPLPGVGERIALDVDPAGIVGLPDEASADGAVGPDTLGA